MVSILASAFAFSSSALTVSRPERLRSARTKRVTPSSAKAWTVARPMPDAAPRRYGQLGRSPKRTASVFRYLLLGQHCKIKTLLASVYPRASLEIVPGHDMRRHHVVSCWFLNTDSRRHNCYLIRGTLQMMVREVPALLFAFSRFAIPRILARWSSEERSPHL
jgi:hypothetical protein